MNIRVNSYALPILAGLALIALPILYFVNQGVSWQPLDPHEHLFENGLTYLLLVLFTYLNHTVFVPRWYLARRYERYVAVALGCILTVALLPHRIEQWAFLKPPNQPTMMGWIGQIFWEENLFPAQPKSPPPLSEGNRLERRPPPPPGFESNSPPKPPTSNGQPLSVKLSIIFLLGGISTLASVSVLTGNRLRQVENENLQAELQQLKAQIHPHFLFNTLNSIYSLAIRKDDRTADTIVKLSEFMRYMIRDAHLDRVSLQKELDYLRNYIDLQQARLRDSVTIDVLIEGDVRGKQIAPLLLFTFIENAFKYGVNPDVDSIIRVSVTIEDAALRLHVFNLKVLTSALDNSTGIGLKNARERLNLLYPNRHTLRIDDTPAHFTVDLTIQFL